MKPYSFFLLLYLCHYTATAQEHQDDRQPAIHQLKEVKITGLNGAQIVQQLLLQIPQNYPQQAFEMTGFYRENAKLDTAWLSCAEAVLHIWNQGYLKTGQKNLISIDKERILAKAGEQEVNNPFHYTLKGVPYLILENDLIKNPGAVFGKNYLRQYDYQIKGTVAVNGEDAWVIAFDQKDDVDEALYTGSITVIKNSFAMAAITICLSPKGKKYAKPDVPLLQRKLMALMGYRIEKTGEALTLAYVKRNAKWYPSYYKMSTTHQLKTRKKPLNGELNINAELFISALDFNTNPAAGYDKKGMMPESYSFHQPVQPNDTKYWQAQARLSEKIITGKYDLQE